MATYSHMLSLVSEGHQGSYSDVCTHAEVSVFLYMLIMLFLQLAVLITDTSYNVSWVEGIECSNKIRQIL